ncbi:hypothetical protein D3C74_273830 [compost metagenome]
MHHRDRRFQCLVPQIQVKLPHLLCRQHPLVHDLAARQAGYVKSIPMFSAAVADRKFSPATDHIELAFKVQIVLQIRGTPDEYLTNERLRRLGRMPQRLVASRHRPETEDPLPFRFGDPHELLLLFGPSRFVMGQEQHANAILSRIRQRESKCCRFGGKKTVRDLQ